MTENKKKQSEPFLNNPNYSDDMMVNPVVVIQYLGQEIGNLNIQIASLKTKLKEYEQRGKPVSPSE